MSYLQNNSILVGESRTNSKTHSEEDLGDLGGNLFHRNENIYIDADKDTVEAQHLQEAQSLQNDLIQSASAAAAAGVAAACIGGASL